MILRQLRTMNLRSRPERLFWFSMTGCCYFLFLQALLTNNCESIETRCYLICVSTSKLVLENPKEKPMTSQRNKLVNKQKNADNTVNP